MHLQTLDRLAGVQLIQDGLSWGALKLSVPCSFSPPSRLAQAYSPMGDGIPRERMEMCKVS